MIKKVGLVCALMFAIGCTDPDLFGIKVTGKYVMRAESVCAMVKSLDLQTITGNEFNCLCMAGPTTEADIIAVRGAFDVMKFVVVRNAYLVQDKGCDPAVSDAESVR